MSVMKLDKAVPSSFGPEGTTFGPEGHDLYGFFETPRFHTMARAQAYFECTQHDWKTYDFDGNPISKDGNGAWQPWLSPESSPYLVSLEYRRPSDPYNLGRAIVMSFTDLLFGEQRFPTFQSKDEDTQHFINQIVKAQELSLNAIAARNIGGSGGSAAFSWCYENGKPVLRVHDTKFMMVYKWKDENDSIPEYVIEVSQYEKDVFVPSENKVKRLQFWYRRDWTLDMDIYFKPVLVEPGVIPNFEIDPEKTVQHDDGICHVIWIKNSHSITEDGSPDYAGQYSKLDTLDILSSITSRGTIKNMDPTLILKTNLELFKHAGGLKKGSDNALVLDSTEAGSDAKYLELAGSSINIALQVFDKKRSQCLEVCRCVIPDPDTIAAQGTSSVAMKMMYSRMISVTDTHRVIYGNALKRLIKDQLTIAKRLQEQGKGFNLEPREVTEEEIDPVTGEHTGNLITFFKPCFPGVRLDFDMLWGEYFPPTQQDIQAKSGAIIQANGGKPIISHETSIELAAKLYGVDPSREIERIRQQSEMIGSDSSLGQDLSDAAAGKVDLEDNEDSNDDVGDLLNPG